VKGQVRKGHKQWLLRRIGPAQSNTVMQYLLQACIVAYKMSQGDGLRSRDTLRANWSVFIARRHMLCMQSAILFY